MSFVTMKLIVNSVEHDVSSSVRSYQISKRACNEEFRHAVSTRTITLAYSAQLFTLVTSDSVLASVDVDGVREFTGRIAPGSIRMQSRGASLSMDPDVEDIQIELEDFSYKLERKIDSSNALVLENVYVCNPLYPSQSAVHILLGLASVEFDILQTISTIIPAFAVDSGTVAEALDTLLYEYGYTYIFDPYGKVVLVQYLFDTPSPSVILDKTEILAPLEVEKLAKEAEAVEVSYYPLKSKQNVLLYMADLPFGENGLRSGWPIQPGYLWPEEANVQETWFEYDDKALANRIDERGKVQANTGFTSIVLTKNHTIEEKFEAGIQRETAVFENKRARIAYRNTGTSAALIYYCNIHGDVVYRSAEVVLRYDLRTNPASVDRYDALFVHDGYSARRLCSFRAERIRSACWRYKFRLRSALEPGTVVRIVDTYAGINALALVIEQYVDLEELVYEYRAIGLAAPTISQPASKAKLLEAPTGSSGDELALLMSAHLVLTPESCALNSDWAGNVNLSDAKTNIEVWMGEKEDTQNWNIAIAESTGVRGWLIDRTYYVSRLETDAGYVDVKATHNNIALLSNAYAKLGQRRFGTIKFAKSVQLMKRFYILKVAPVGTNPLVEHLHQNQGFLDNLTNPQFIESLVSRVAFLESLFSKYIKIQNGGSIRGGDRYTADGSDTMQNVPGFWQGSNGIFKIANGLIDIKDALNRRIKISTDDGLKALDAQGKIIHDIPDQPIASGEFYMGHLIWWQDPGVNLVYTAVTTAQVWNTVNIAKRSYQNIKGVILDIYCSYNPSQNVAWGNTRVAFRPYGSSLGPDDCFTPYASMNLTGDYVDYLRTSMMIIIPVGVNGSNLSFQYWAGQELALLVIGQRGILI